jgi:hypothetical protein
VPVLRPNFMPEMLPDCPPIANETGCKKFMHVSRHNHDRIGIMKGRYMSFSSIQRGGLAVPKSRVRSR